MTNQSTYLWKFWISWIDPHFLSAWLWRPDFRKQRQYPVDKLFQKEILDDATIKDRHKFGELLVAPCKIRILTVETDPKAFLFEPDFLQKLIYSAKENPCVKFWESFKKDNYEQAASYIDKVRKLTRSNEVKQIIFLGTVQALCYLQAKQNTKAINQFLKMGADFHRAKLDSYCNLCFFFAIEAAREIEDLNQRDAAMKKIVRKIPDLNPDAQKEILNILLSYAGSIYLGAAVLCRRVLELTLTQILTTRYKKTIPQLIKECQKTGSLDKGIGPGLYGVLMVSKSRRVLMSSEFEIASNIKDFGNRIHSPGGVKNAIDAKYAIQACIHIMRRLNQKIPLKKQTNKIDEARAENPLSPM